jgi:hypothetical protein
VGTRRRVTIVTVVVLAASAVPALAQDVTPGPPAEVLERARGQARAAQVRANEIAAEGRGPGQAPPGLAKAGEKLRGWERTGRGNAGRVHEALLAGRSPSELAGLNAEAARAMAEATKALKEAGEKPGLGLGRGRGDDADDG